MSFVTAMVTFLMNAMYAEDLERKMIAGTAMMIQIMIIPPVIRIVQEYGVEQRLKMSAAYVEALALKRILTAKATA